MENWLKEQIKFGRSICLYDKEWNPVYCINPIQYKDSFFNFISETFDPNIHHLIADNKNLRAKIPGYQFYTYFPNRNNPMEIWKIFDYFEEINSLLKTPHWKDIGKESTMLPNEIMDHIWKNFYSNVIVERINNFFHLINWKMDLYYENYYIYCLVCWIEQHFELIFSKLDLLDQKVIKMLKKIESETDKIKKRDYSFESKCPQFLSFCHKWNKVFAKK